jgi:phage terminase large subunit GpA-like protein
MRKSFNVKTVAYNVLTVPMGGCILTSGIGVHDNRLAIIMNTRVQGKESWLVSRW